MRVTIYYITGKILLCFTLFMMKICDFLLERSSLCLLKRHTYCLLISILFEQIGTGFLEATKAFTFLKPTIIVIVAYVISYILFSKILEKINLSVAYATWTALGTISAALIGLIAYKQVISVAGWIAIFIMCAGIAILNLFGTPKEEKGGNGKKNGGDAE